MLSLKRCRKLLGRRYKNLTTKEIKELRGQLYSLAGAVFEDATADPKEVSFQLKSRRKIARVKKGSPRRMTVRRVSSRRRDSSKERAQMG